MPATTTLLRPEIKIQYKGTRARDMNQKKPEDTHLEGAVISGFHSDLKTLSIYPFPMKECHIIWKTGLVKAKFPPLNAEACHAVKYMIRRALTEPSKKIILSDLMIANIQYIQGGLCVPTDNLPRKMSSPLALEDGVSRASSATAGVSSRAPALGIASIGAVTAPKSLGSNSKTFESHPHHDIQSIYCPSSIFDVCVNLAGASAAQVHKTPDNHSPQRLQAQQGHQITFQEQIQRVQSGKGLIKPPQSPFEQSFGQNAEANLPPFPFQSAYRTLQSGSSDPTPSVLHSPPLVHIKSTGNGSSLTTSAPQAARPSTPSQASPGKSFSSFLSLASAPSESSTCPHPQQKLPVAHLTSGSCQQLRDRTEDAILSTCPVIRVLVIRRADPSVAGGDSKAFEVFVTDGMGYAWVALSEALRGRVGDPDNKVHLQVGSAVKLKGMSRQPLADNCPVLVNDFELVDVRSSGDRATEITAKFSSVSGTSPTASLPQGGLSSMTSLDPDSAAAVQKERAQRLLAEMRYREEHETRLILERALADVCAEMERRATQEPALQEALRRIENLVAGVMAPD